MAEIIEVYSAAEIADRIQTIAADISRRTTARNLSILGVLEDSFVFIADLLRAMSLSPQTVFLDTITNQSAASKTFHSLRGWMFRGAT